MVDAKVGKTGLFMCLITVYTDASEALHGTLYGAVFHLGAYDPGTVPQDEQSMLLHHSQTLSTLYLLAAGAIDDLLNSWRLSERYMQGPPSRSRTNVSSLRQSM